MTDKLKRGPLSKVEAFYVENNVSSLSAEEIASDLHRTKSSVEKYIKKNCNSNKPLTAGDQFARQSGATIMTENASMIADEHKSKAVKPKPSCVTNIK